MVNINPTIVSRRYNMEHLSTQELGTHTYMGCASMGSKHSTHSHTCTARGHYTLSHTDCHGNTSTMLLLHESKMDVTELAVPPFTKMGQTERGRESVCVCVCVWREKCYIVPPPPTCLVAMQLRGHLGTNCQHSPTKPHSYSLEPCQHTTIDKIPGPSAKQLKYYSKFRPA